MIRVAGVVLVAVVALGCFCALGRCGDDSAVPPPPGPAPAARPEGPPAPGPVETPPVPAPPPLPLEEVDKLLKRAQPNMFLHGLSLDESFLHKAVEDFRTAAARMPPESGDSRRFDANFSLAFCLARMDPFPSEGPARTALIDEAVARLRDAAGLNGSFPGLWIVGGMLLEVKGDPKQAVADITQGFALLDKATDLQPWQRYQLRFFGLLARTRALLQTSVNREDLAVEDAKKALALAEEARTNPDTPAGPNRLRGVAKTHLAAAYERMSDFPAAERILNELIREDPNSFDHRFNLAIVLAEQQKFEGSLANYREAARSAPRDPRPHIKIGYILLTFLAGGEADIVSAEREAEIFLSLTGGKGAEYCALRGEAAFQRRDLMKAEEWFRESLGFDPGCIHSLDRLVKILGESEKPSPARKAELEQFRKRLTEGTERRAPGSGAPDEGRVDRTFC